MCLDCVQLDNNVVENFLLPVGCRDCMEMLHGLDNFPHPMNLQEQPFLNSCLQSTAVVFSPVATVNVVGASALTVAGNRPVHPVPVGPPPYPAFTPAFEWGAGSEEYANLYFMRNILLDVFIPLLAKICLKRWEQVCARNSGVCPGCGGTNCGGIASNVTVMCFRVPINKHVQHLNAQAGNVLSHDANSLRISFSGLPGDREKLTEELLIGKCDVSVLLSLVAMWETMLLGASGEFYSKSQAMHLKGIRNSISHSNTLSNELFGNQCRELEVMLDNIVGNMKRSDEWAVEELGHVSELLALFQRYAANSTASLSPLTLFQASCEQIQKESNLQSLSVVSRLIESDALGTVGKNSLQAAKDLCDHNIIRRYLIVPPLSLNSCDDFFKNMVSLVECCQWSMVYNMNSASHPFTVLFAQKLASPEWRGKELPFFSGNQPLGKLENFRDFNRTFDDSVKSISVIAAFGDLLVDHMSCVVLTGYLMHVGLMDNIGDSTKLHFCRFLAHPENANFIANEYYPHQREVADPSSSPGMSDVINIVLVVAYLRAQQHEFRENVLLLPALGSRDLHAATKEESENLERKNEKEIQFQKEKEKAFPLHAAVKANDINAVQSLLAVVQLDLNLTDDNGRTAFHWAAFHGYLEISEMLVNDLRLSMDIADRVFERHLRCYVVTHHWCY